MATRTAHGEVSLALTEAQRRLTAELAPSFADRLRLDERNQRSVRFSAAEVQSIQLAAENALRTTDSGTQRNSLRHIIHKSKITLNQPVVGGGGIKTGQVYRFKIALLDFKPTIWRRIEVKDCTFDKLHEHIQTAMGWTNSHLHMFEFLGQRIGDPELLDDGFMEFECVDSTETRLSEFLPADASGTSFLYEYDFGDGWQHEITLESVAPPKKGKCYPVCLAGKRSCPPEDVGGVWGYAEFLEAVADPDHERHEELLEWCGGSFDPDDFDPLEATDAMHGGLPDWRI